MQSCFQTDDLRVGADERELEAPTRVYPGSRRCRMHGGASTGPRTAEGLARSRLRAGNMGSILPRRDQSKSGAPGKGSTHESARGLYS
jgi:hypothetical protein